MATRISLRQKLPTAKALEVQQNVNEAARKEAEELATTYANIAQNEPGAAETMLSLSTPLDFSALEGDGAKYVKYLKQKLTTKSPAVVFATKAFGPKVVANFIARRKAVRYMFAPTDNTGQCKRAGLTFPPKIDTTCWLCGYGLYRNGKPVDVIACEHVLPVIQAVLFADIALPTLPSTSQRDLVEAEYGWAHTVCNGPKSSSVFIKEIYDKKGHIVKWDIDNDEITDVLKKTFPLIKQKNIDAGQLTDETKWIKTQIVNITLKIQPILDRINFGEDSVRFNILRSAAKLLDNERLASNVQIDEKAYAEHADQIEQFIGSTAESSLSMDQERLSYSEPPAKRQRATGRRRKRNRKTRRIRK